VKRCGACGSEFESGSWECPVCGYQPARIGGFRAFAPAVAHDGPGFQPEYFATLAEVEERHFWFRARNELILWALHKCACRVERFLEIGCGTGFVISAVARAYPEASVTGTELLSAGLPYAASRVPTAELLQLDARDIPYRSHFDIVGAFDVLEHIEEDDTVLRAVYRALRPGGRLIVTVPQHPWLWSRQDDYACHVRRYTAMELGEKLVGAGFGIVLRTSFVSLLLPLFWLSRRLLRCESGKEVDARRELRIGDFANGILGTVMRLERSAIVSGVRFPFGGSLLVVAQRK